MTHTDCKLGAVQQQNDGHGFVVRKAQRPDNVFEVRAIQAKAKEAHSLIAKAIEGPEITLIAVR
jgi:hypothetical protein